MTIVLKVYIYLWLFSIELEQKLSTLSAKKASLENALEKMLNFLKTKEMVEMLKEEKLFNMSYIKTNFQFEEKHLDMLFSYSKLLYESGFYSGIYAYIPFIFTFRCFKLFIYF